MTPDAKLDGRVAELDALDVRDGLSLATFIHAWRTWLRDAALRGIDPKGGQDLPLASDDASGVGTGAIASSVERSPASPAGLDPKPTEQGWVSVTERLPESEALVCVWVKSYYQGKGGHDQAMLIAGVWTNMRYRQRLDVTHWMPLPAAPSAAGRESDPLPPLDPDVAKAFELAATWAEKKSQQLFDPADPDYQYQVGYANARADAATEIRTQARRALLKLTQDGRAG